MSDAPTTASKPFVFVLMPFSEEFSDCYEFGIKEACAESGAYCERVDEQIFDERILDRIYNQISKADIVIADMTGRNPNVFYEVGYAHGIQKRVILVTQDVKDIPFDFLHFPHIIYGGKISKLKSDLKIKVRRFIENPGDVNANDSTLDVYGNGVYINTRPKYISEVEIGQDLRLKLALDLNNAVTNRIAACRFELGVMAPPLFDSMFARRIPAPSGTAAYDVKKIALVKEPPFYLIDKIFDMRPGSWEKVELVLSGEEVGGKERKRSFDFALHILTDTGTLELPFSAELSFVYQISRPEGWE